MRTVTFFWFPGDDEPEQEPEHCKACETAKRAGAIFALMVDNSWTDAEQARLRYEASFILED